MFNKKLIALRKSKKLTQEEMAEKIGVHRGTYANYERGHRQPDYETLVKIADFFEVSTDYLLRGTDPKVQDKIFEDEAKRILSDPKTFLAARDGEVTQEILDAALEIITEQLKEGGKKKSD
ncbi:MULTISPECIES: helix-turn-helix domain-containing protein [Bacillus subtilis group]|uniref:helix-turn-helix domain-containing protein n=1 Tax=Bacillus subtilis group TaxID=653685 RepID=UPI0011ECF342|nr:MULTISPECIES: helix-turn-helix transcriptional regulator [Bacillus subtilis group]MCM3754617.1 helix-turn-helix domain-containing protein [Bacillus licheniformis]MEC0475614.1 helix-turn-helix transcriptional regulator [Bacillus licheniformis]MEC2293148.1 helix-turn-helix transcriptional regulator [Bacillus licheniformis]QEO06651.1 helix-turn-helix transcriptional regulator [Bacillus paralicheniformis]